MTKLILIVVAVVAVVWLLRRAIAGPGAPKPPADAAKQKGELVACAQCGVNLPKGEAYAAGGVQANAGGVQANAGGVQANAGGVQPGAGERFYCSEEHSRLGPREG